MTARRRLGHPVHSRGQGTFPIGPFDGRLEKFIKMQMHFRRRGGQVMWEVGFREEF